MKKKRISKKIFNVVKNRVLGKKVEKKKAKYFFGKKFGGKKKYLEKKNILEIFFSLFSREGGGKLFGNFGYS